MTFPSSTLNSFSLSLKYLWLTDRYICLYDMQFQVLNKMHRNRCVFKFKRYQKNSQEILLFCLAVLLFCYWLLKSDINENDRSIKHLFSKPGLHPDLFQFRRTVLALSREQWKKRKVYSKITFICKFEKRFCELF